MEHVPNTSFTMEAFTDHWLQVPTYQYIVDLEVPEEIVRIAMIKNVEADIAFGISPTRIGEAINEGWHTEKIGLPVLFNLSFTANWVENKPTSDIRVRKAISYAVNRQELCDTYFMGVARPGGRWYMHESTWGWNPSWQPDPFNPDLARQLLADASYPDAFDTSTITYFTTTGTAQDIGLILQGYWAAVGLDVKIEPVDMTTYAGMFFNRNTTPGTPNVGAIFPYARESVFDNTYHSENMYTSTGIHSTANDPEADRLYYEAMGTFDDTERKRLWTEFQNYVYEELFINCPLVIIEPHVLLSPNLGEVTTNAHLGLAEAFAGIQHPE